MSAYCPGLPDDAYPCGRALLPSDVTGLCLECELRAEHSHGIDLVRAAREADNA